MSSFFSFLDRRIVSLDLRISYWWSVEYEALFKNNIYKINVLWKLENFTLKYYRLLIDFSKEMISHSLCLYQWVRRAQDFYPGLLAKCQKVVISPQSRWLPHKNF